MSSSSVHALNSNIWWVLRKFLSSGDECENSLLVTTYILYYYYTYVILTIQILVEGGIEKSSIHPSIFRLAGLAGHVAGAAA